MTTHGIELRGLNLVCADVDATLAFYRLAGLDVADDALWWTPSGVHHITVPDAGRSMELELDSTALAPHYNAGYAADPTATSVVVGFQVPTRDAVDEVHARLVAAGHPDRQPPYDAFWGARYAIVADPDGRDVGFMSPSDADRRTPPPTL